MTMLLPFVLAGALQSDGQADFPPLVPYPARVSYGAGVLQLDPGVSIVAGRGAKETGEYLKSVLEPATGYTFKMANQATGQAIELRLIKGDAELGEEGYHLGVGPKGVQISAHTSAGLFYGVQTLRQLFPAQIYSHERMGGMTWTLPYVEIEDQPRFGWRGFMLDVSRHFEPKPVVKRLLDTMAMHKLNRFHWHLTDDPGWRIEIKKHPRLTEIGTTQNWDTFNKPLDGKNHGGFYTQDDIREIVAYAKKLHIIVVPEIEMPGHSGAAIASYHELGVWNNKPQDNPWALESSNLNVEDSTIQFYKDVLDEVMKLFPSPWIHIGGDEVDKGPWKSNARVQELMKQRGIANEDKLQSWFISQFDHYLTSHGRRLIGWDEILEGGLAQNATVMSWRGIEGGIAAAKAGHDAVMTPTSHMYFDYLQGKPETEPRGIGGFLPLERVYSYEPVAAALTSDEAKYVLGVQGNLWTEFVATPKHMEYMAWPRGCALSEVAWSPKSARNWSSFLARLKMDLVRFNVLGVNFRPLDNSFAEIKD